MLEYFSIFSYEDFISDIAVVIRSFSLVLVLYIVC